MHWNVVTTAKNKRNVKRMVKEIDLKEETPLFSTRRLAEYFDLKRDDGTWATETIVLWWHSGKLPPPDIKLSRKAVYWKPSTIKAFVESQY